MKIISTLSFALIFALSLFAQTDTSIIFLDNEEKRITEERAVKYAVITKEKNQWKKVVFDALDDKPLYGAYYSDPACTLHEGAYTSFNKKQKTSTTGQYSNNKKEGLWKEFSDDGKLIDSVVYKNDFITGIGLRWYEDGSLRDSLKFGDGGNGTLKGYWPDGVIKDFGEYKAGKKSGQWIYYHKSGLKCQEVDYLEDSALSYTCFDEDGKVLQKECIYEKEAIFAGGDKAWVKYLSKKLLSVKLPAVYEQGKVHGVVYIMFVVGTDGKLVDIRALNSVHPDLDEIALNVIRKSPPWEPAIQFGRKVKAYRKQPINFAKVE